MTLFKCPPGHFLFLDVIGVAAKDRGCSGRKKARTGRAGGGITVLRRRILFLDVPGLARRQGQSARPGRASGRQLASAWLPISQPNSRRLRGLLQRPGGRCHVRPGPWSCARLHGALQRWRSCVARHGLRPEPRPWPVSSPARRGRLLWQRARVSSVRTWSASCW